VKTRAERTEAILADLRDLWQHMDREHPIVSAGDAAGMARAGMQLLLGGQPGEHNLGDAMAQAVLLLTMVRETIVETERGPHS
jgi:hypothetical protein